MVKLAPLPARAQFLNVIESVFSGMSRSIIQNSDYESVSAAQAAIDRYFSERNDYFGKNPQRAGKKSGETPGKHRIGNLGNLTALPYSQKCQFRADLCKWRKLREYQDISRHQTVDQEVGGSSPPSCTGKIKYLVMT